MDSDFEKTIKRLSKAYMEVSCDLSKERRKSSSLREEGYQQGKDEAFISFMEVYSSVKYGASMSMDSGLKVILSKMRAFLQSNGYIVIDDKFVREMLHNAFSDDYCTASYATGQVGVGRAMIDKVIEDGLIRDGKVILHAKVSVR